jgi:hypothetical protein
MSTITIELDDELLAHVRSIAGPEKADVEEFIRDLVATHAGPEYKFTAEQIALIQQSLDDPRPSIPHEEVMAEMDRLLSSGR